VAEFDRVAPAQQTSGIDRLGLALQGFGAGVQGRGLEFQQGLRQDRAERQRLTLERKKAFAQDLVGARGLLASGDSAGALQLLDNRTAIIDQLGGDASDTLSLSQAIASAESIQDAGAIVDDLDTLINRSRAAGLLPEEERVSALDQARTEKLQAETAALSAPAQVDQKQVNTLRKDIKDLSKTFRLVDEANERIKKVGRKGTAASDISLIFNFMKINDPGSTVREGEFATAQNAAGVPGRVTNLYNQMLKGTRLNKEQREDFLAQSQSLFDGQRASTDAQVDNILQQADQDGIDRVRVIGKDRLAAFEARQNPLSQLPVGSIDNGDGTFTLPTGERVEPDR
jgi:hypothetical protein